MHSCLCGLIEETQQIKLVAFSFSKAIIALIIACTDLPSHCHRIWTLRALSKIHWLCIGKWRHDILQMQSALGQKLGNKEEKHKESFNSLLSSHCASCQVCLEMTYRLGEHTRMWQFHSHKTLSVPQSHSCLACLVHPTFSKVNQEDFFSQAANLIRQNHRVGQVGRITEDHLAQISCSDWIIPEHVFHGSRWFCNISSENCYLVSNQKKPFTWVP